MPFGKRNRNSESTSEMIDFSVRMSISSVAAVMLALDQQASNLTEAIRLADLDCGELGAERPQEPLNALSLGQALEGVDEGEQQFSIICISYDRENFSYFPQLIAIEIAKNGPLLRSLRDSKASRDWRSWGDSISDIKQNFPPLLINAHMMKAWLSQYQTLSADAQINRPYSSNGEQALKRSLAIICSKVPSWMANMEKLSDMANRWLGLPLILKLPATDETSRFGGIAVNSEIRRGLIDPYFWLSWKRR
jgi:hypothetical protein